MSNEEMATAIRDGEDQNGNLLMALWGDNSGYIAAIIGNYSGLCDVDDLWQESFIGLMSAIQHWAPENGSLFMTYASFWIRQACVRFIEKNQGIPIGKQAMIRRLHKVENEFEQSHGRSPSDAEICDLMEISENDLDELRKAENGQNRASLDEMRETDDGESYSLEPVSDEDPEGDAVDRMQHEELRSALWDEVDRLPAEQAGVLHGRYEDELTAKQVGELTGQSGQQVADIERKALAKMRTTPRTRERLMPFLDDQIRSGSLRGNGVGVFNRTWSSSTERTAIQMIEKEEE